MKYLLILICAVFSYLNTTANNMLVQNVTTLGDDPLNRTIQVQFDISWDNSWRDSINYDAAWVFIKFKNASGLWQHAQLNQTGFNPGTGTADSLKVTSDKVGAWVYRSGLGSGTFNVTGMQLQWNYGLSGLTSVAGLEVRVFAVEMVYVPEGEFNVAKRFYSNTTVGTLLPRSFSAPGNNFPVINSRLTPSLTYDDGTTTVVRLKGDAGIDTNNDGVVDNTTYPVGYRAFYSFKYELSEQQYADFLNTLTSTQITALGVAGSGITLSNGQYFSSTPNKACGNATETRFYAYADWSGLRPMSLLEMNKASYGPLQPVLLSVCSPSGNNISLNGYPAWGSNGCPLSLPEISISGGASLQNVGYNARVNSTRQSSGASYYGVMDLTWNAVEPVVRLTAFNFTADNGNGVLTTGGLSDITSWQVGNVIYWDQASANRGPLNFGFRYVRSAE